MTESNAAVSTPAPGVSDLLNSSAAPQQPPPPPKFMPTGFPVAPPAFNEPTAISARAEIESLKSDKEFFAALKAEGERGVSGPAKQRWASLHAAGFPSPVAIASQSDVDGQAANRSAELWNAHIADLKTRFPLTAEQEAEIRGGVVDERAYAWAVEQKGLLIKDKSFYRKILDGDRAANRDWGLVTSILSLRPVKRA
jgi:hypothetical protein